MRPGTKYDKALEIGVPVLDEAGFEVLLERGPDAAREVATDVGLTSQLLSSRSQSVIVYSEGLRSEAVRSASRRLG